jgi:hypothetical protein
MTKEILYREISFQTLFMSNYSIIHYKVNLKLSIKIDTKLVMWYFGDILQYFVTILRKLDEISYPPYSVLRRRPLAGSSKLEYRRLLAGNF